MTNNGGTRLEDVLDLMLEEHGEPSLKAVAAYSRIHPEHRPALVDFAARWAEEKHLPVTERPRDYNSAVKAAADAFSRALHASAGPVRLSELAKSAGLTLQDLARRCGLHASILTKLDGGRIKPGSVGDALPTMLGRLLDVSSETALASFAPRQNAPVTAGFLNPSCFQRTETLREALMSVGTDLATMKELELPD